MKNDNLNKQPHWRCRLCGHSTPLGEAVCSNPSCRADLGIYGEAVTPGREEPDRRARKQQEEEARRRMEEAAQRDEEQRQRTEEQRRQREAAQRQRDEAQRQKEEAQRQKAEEKARKKSQRQFDRSGGGAAKWLIPALAVALIAALGIGAGVLLSSRGTADGPTPPRQSANPGPASPQSEEPGAPESGDPGPGESTPGQGEAPDPNAWRGNVLMADPNLGDPDELGEYPAFGGTSQDGLFSGTFTRKDFCSITFMDSLDDLHGAYWDVSQAQDGSVMAWADLTSTDKGEYLYDLFIGADGGVEAPADCSGMFECYVNVERISFNGAFHTENTTDMSFMFECCEALKALDLSGLNTLGLSGWNTSSVADMRRMFSACTSLTQLNLGGFDTSCVTDMSGMFSVCSSLAQLDLGGFDTSGVTDMSAMFAYCENLRELGISGFDTSNVTDMGYMFRDCSSLRELDVTGFDTANVTDMANMFRGCSSLRELDVSGFDTSNVTDMSYMFRGCSGLAELDITNFKTSKVTDMSYMFAGVNSGFALHFTRANFDTSNVTNNKGFMDDSFDWRKMFE